MNRSFRLTAAICLVLFLSIGCSQGSGPSSPGIDEPFIPRGIDSEEIHGILGLWSFVCDPESKTIEIIPLRDADIHLNALKFLEPPTLLYLTLEGPPQFNGNILDVNIGLRNPYLGYDQFSGFDVCGILFTHGSLTGFNDPDLIIAGEGDGHLLNADGYTRWWNPSEFPHVGTIFGYKDGLLGTPADTTDFNCTINGYKYFADGLEMNDPVTSIDLEKRGMFRAGQKNVRHYKIDMGSELVFNYAVDANWKQPTGGPPYSVPDDFPEGANRPEAYFVSVTELENSLASNGISGSGTLSLRIDVWDHFNAELNQVSGESLTGLPHISSIAPIGGGNGFSTYQLDFTGATLGQFGDAELLITVQSEQTGYNDLLPGKPISSYFTHTFTIAEAPPGDGWARVWGGSGGGYEYGLSVATDQYANCYVSGTTFGDVDFDPGPGEDIHNNGASSISKFNANGVYQWAQSWTAGRAWGVDVDSAGNVYVAGGSNGAFLRKYDPDGVLIWNYKWGIGSGKRVEVDDDDYVYFTGQCSSGQDIDPTDGTDPASYGGTFLAKFDSSGTYLWGTSWEGSYPYGLCAHGSGEIYISGHFEGSGDFDPGFDSEIHSSNGSQDVYMMKFDSDGNYQWCRTWGGAAKDISYRICTDGSGSVYAVGWFGDEVDFAPELGEDLHTAAGEEDSFVSKFDTDGNFIWAITWGGNEASGSPYYSDLCTGLGIDSIGNLYLSGAFSMTADFDPGPGLEERTSIGYSDVYLLKLDNDGTFIWVQTWGGEMEDEGWGGTVTSDGISFVTGSFEGTVDFDPGPGILEFTANGGYDVFVSRFPPDGDW